MRPLFRTSIISITILALGVACLGAVVAVVARSSDGPIGPFAGGPFRSGELVPEAKVDWESLARTPTVELQLVDPPRSRTTHIVVLDGQAYVPSGIVKVGPFVFLGQVFWKNWPDEVLKDPRVIIRSDGRLYDARAVKVGDPQIHAALSALTSAKYDMHLGELPDPHRVWFFRLEPRDPGP